jgi:hypothetical protein
MLSQGGVMSLTDRVRVLPSIAGGVIVSSASFAGLLFSAQYLIPLFLRYAESPVSRAITPIIAISSMGFAGYGLAKGRRKKPQVLERM